jgi:hypothetical protein
MCHLAMLEGIPEERERRSSNPVTRLPVAIEAGE